MPFTLAHPAAILPLLGRRRAWFDSTCLVAGSMAPDFEYFARARMESDVSHTVLGLVAFDVPVALVLAVVFHALVRAPLASALPRALRARFAGFLAAPWRPSALVAVTSALIGAASHLAWDACTHRTGIVVAHSDVLSSVVALPWLGDVAAYRTLQHASTPVGLGLLALAVRRLPRVAIVPAHSPRARLLFVLVPAVCALAFAVARVLLEGGALSRSYGHAIAAGMSGLVVGIVLAAACVRATARTVT